MSRGGAEEERRTRCTAAESKQQVSMSVVGGGGTCPLHNPVKTSTISQSPHSSALALRWSPITYTASAPRRSAPRRGSGTEQCDARRFTNGSYSVDLRHCYDPTACLVASELLYPNVQRNKNELRLLFRNGEEVGGFSPDCLSKGNTFENVFSRPLTVFCS